MAWLALTSSLAVIGATGLAAQALVTPDSALPAGTITGSVVAAESGIPLENAVVVIEPAPSGALPAESHGPSFWEAGRTARTDANGIYRFGRLTVGSYVLHVRRLGYRAATIEIDLRSQSPFRVSVGLVVLPIALDAVEVTGTALSRLQLRADSEAAGLIRLGAAAALRRRFLVTDARSLTGADLLEAITLGETDLFRALQRLPSVTTRDDYSAELWTRGSRWTDTRVTFDGLPLLSPLHAGGVFAGVDPDVIGSAFFLPGVRPASAAEGDAATVDLTTRPAAEPGLHGLTELSLISGRVVFEHGAVGTGPRWVLAARRSYIDLASKLVASLGNDSTADVPYAFTDLTGRLDVPLGGVRALEVSGLISRDGLRGSVPNLLQRSRGHWGDALIRATLAVPIGGWSARFTAGESRYSVHIDDTSAVPGDANSFNIPFPTRTESAITYRVLSGAFAPGAGDAWSAGYEVVWQHLDYDGTDPTSHPDSALTPPKRSFTGATSVIALWGEHQWKPSPRLTVKPGLRAELGSALANASGVRLAPRVQGRYLVTRAVTLSAGYGRTYQYAQAVGPAGPGVGPQLHLSEVWLLAGDTVPAIRSDIATVGVEYSLGGEWVVGLDLYQRHATGVAVPDPTPGPFLANRPLFVAAENSAHGAEASVRKLAGRWTASASLALSGSQLSAAGYHYPAPNDRRRVFHATALTRLRPGVRLGTAVTVASGAAFTRFVGSIDAWRDSLIPYTTLPYADLPGGIHGPGFATLDALVDWTHVGRASTVEAYVQLRNALGATNAVIYAGSVEGCAGATPPTKVQVARGVCDYYVRSLPRLPLAGVRVSF